MILGARRRVPICEANAMSVTRRVVLAAAVGCGLTMMGAGGADDKRPAPDVEAIKSVVAHFAKNDIKLEKE